MSITSLQQSRSTNQHHQVRWIPLLNFAHSGGIEYKDVHSFQFPISNSWYAIECHSTKFGALVVLENLGASSQDKKLPLQQEQTYRKAFRCEMAFTGTVCNEKETTESNFIDSSLAFPCEYWRETPSASSLVTFANNPAYVSTVQSGFINENGDALVMHQSFLHLTCTRNPDDPFVDMAHNKRSTTLLTRTGVLYSIGYSFDGIRGFKHWPQHSYDDVINKIKIDAQSSVKFSHVSGGMFHFCALSDTGDVYAWGRNNKGQCTVSVGASAFLPMATKVQGLPEPMIAVEAGNYYNIAVSKSLKLVGWGGSPKNYVPRVIKIPNNETPLKISANGCHYFAVLTDRGNVYMYADSFTLLKKWNNETGVVQVGAHIVNISVGHSNLSLVEFHDRNNPELTYSQENLPQQLLSLQTDRSNDVKIRFQDQVFELHRGILAARSVLFENLFSEEREEYDVTDYVPSTTTDIFSSAIDFIYAATIPDNSKEKSDNLTAVIKELKVRTELGERIGCNLRGELIRDIGCMITRDEHEAKILGADVTFTFKDSNADTKLFAHKYLLTKRSPYFHAMFSSGMHDESHSSIIEVADVSIQALQLILTFIYTGKIDASSITIDNCIESMITANEYGEEGLYMFIEDHVVRLIDLDTVLVLSDLAKRFKFRYLDERCEFFMRCHADTLKQLEQLT